MLVNAANVQGIFQNLRAEFNRVFDESESHWDKVATLIPSNALTELYVWVSMFPKMKEWLGEKVIKQLELFSYSITNKEFEATVSVIRSHIETDQLGIYGPMAQNAGKSAKEWPDDLVFPLLKKGFTSLCYDKQYFFDTDHPVGGSSVSNFGGGTGTPWYLLDTRWPVKPLIFQRRKEPNFVSQVDPQTDSVFMRGEFRFGAESSGNSGYGLWQMAYASKDTLTKSNFDAAVQAMEELENDEGSPLKISPNLLVVEPSLRATARDLIKAERDASGATNTLFGAVDLLVTQLVK